MNLIEAWKACSKNGVLTINGLTAGKPSDYDGIREYIYRNQTSSEKILSDQWGIQKEHHRVYFHRIIKREAGYVQDSMLHMLGNLPQGIPMDFTVEWDE